MKSIWKRYVNRIYGNCTEPIQFGKSLDYWRNELFAATVIYIIPLSLIAVIPGVYMSYISGLYPLLLVDVIAVGSIIGVAFIPRLSVFTRKLIFCGALYITSIALLYYLGSSGPGLLYLLALTIFIILCLEIKYAQAAVILNALICTLIGLALHFDTLGQSPLTSEYEFDTWIAVSSNLVFLSAVAVFLLPKLFGGLQSTIEEHEKLETKLEKNQERLEDSIKQLYNKNKELEDFSYTVSHDLKEPLRMIRSFLELLKKKYDGKLDKKAREYIYFATDGAQRLNTMIDDLLEYSRAGRVYTEIDEVDMNDLMEGIKMQFAGDIHAKKAKLRYNSLPTIRASSVSINTVFRNLVNNALKYHRPEIPPVIEITAEERNSDWLFTVQDNGIGIKAEYFDQIFSMFRRLHNSEDYPGSGMGLAICKKIVEQHGGDIWVESEDENGCKFCFTISKEVH